MWCGVSFRRILWQSEVVQYGELLSIISNVSICRSCKDFRIWKPCSFEDFSVKTFYLALEGNRLPRAPSLLVWLELVPPRVEAFCWLAVAVKASTTDNLRGLTFNNLSNNCVMCRKESINHLISIRAL